jgi:LysR family transcriptional regulator, glycine cleavage system transcriptional activator
MVHLPPVSGLRALEAAARHLSFTKAANELNVTQSAISHQIKHLEELWGLTLFTRLTRKLELTQAGEALASIARDFFRKLENTLDDLKGDDGHSALRVQALPSVAAKWLVPRLQRFREREPDVDVWLSTRMHEQSAMDAGKLEGAIRFGRDETPGWETWPLMNEYVFPVARPRFLEQQGWPKDPEDLCRYPLLLRLGEVGAPLWDTWFETVGVSESIYEPALRDGTRFPDSSMALQAAFEGQGVALARSAPVWEDITSGRLVRLFDITCPYLYPINFVCPREKADQPSIIAFRNWLIEEAQRSQVEFDAAESNQP